MGKKAKRTASIRADNLTKGQRAFAEAYALSGNGAAAYMKAFPGSKKHTSQYRAEKAAKLLAKANIRDKVKSLEQKVVQIAEKKFEVSAQRVLEEICALAFSQSRDYFDWGTRHVPMFTKKGEPIMHPDTGKQLLQAEPYMILKPASELTELQAKAISGVEMTVSKTGDKVVNVKVTEKMSALKLLAQHTKLIGAEGKGSKLDIDTKSGKITVMVMPEESDV